MDNRQSSPSSSSTTSSSPMSLASSAPSSPSLSPSKAPRGRDLIEEGIRSYFQSKAANMDLSDENSAPPLKRSRDLIVEEYILNHQLSSSLPDSTKYDHVTLEMILPVMDSMAAWRLYAQAAMNKEATIADISGKIAYLQQMIEQFEATKDPKKEPNFMFKARIAQLELRRGNRERCLELMEVLQKDLDSVCDKVRAYYYLAATLCYWSNRQFSACYRNCVLLLKYGSQNLVLDEKKQKKNLGLMLYCSAVLGEDVYSFEDLISEQIVQNSGLVPFQKVSSSMFSGDFRAIEEYLSRENVGVPRCLVDNRQFLVAKALMINIVNGLPSDKAQIIKVEDVAMRLSITPENVERLFAKCISANLIEGRIKRNGTDTLVLVKKL